MEWFVYFPSTVLCPAIAIGVYYAIGAYFGQFLHTHVSQIECIIFYLQLHIIPEDWFSLQMLFCVAIFRQTFDFLSQH